MTDFTEYPPIDHHKDYNSPYEKLKELKSFPVVEEFYKDDKIHLISYNKGFFGKKKLYETIIEKVQVDASLKSYDEDADDNFFGITIYHKGNVAYKSLYNLGVFKACILSIRDYHLNESMSLLEMGIFGGFDVEHHRNASKFLSRFDNTLELLNVLFAGTNSCSIS